MWCMDDVIGDGIVEMASAESRVYSGTIGWNELGLLKAIYP